MTCFIQLTGKHGKNKFAIVDKEDFDYLIQYKWNINISNYITTSIKGKSYRMHRMIMNCPNGKFIDHKNHNTLDNRKENLRICSRTENNRNSLKKSGAVKSNYKGIHQGASNSWIVELQGRYLGCCKTEIIAAEHYDYYAIQEFGEFAHLNFPEKDYSAFEVNFNIVNKTSKFIGVHRNRVCYWTASIEAFGKTINLGRFKNEDEAARARDEFVKFNNLNRKLNFPLENENDYKT